MTAAYLGSFATQAQSARSAVRAATSWAAEAGLVECGDDKAGLLTYLKRAQAQIGQINTLEHLAAGQTCQDGPLHVVTPRGTGTWTESHAPQPVATCAPRCAHTLTMPLPRHPCHANRQNRRAHDVFGGVITGFREFATLCDDVRDLRLRRFASISPDQ